MRRVTVNSDLGLKAELSGLPAQTKLIPEGGKGGISRRDFVKFCTAAAVYMGLPASMGERIAQAATTAKRPPVLWLSAQECTGCVETLLRATHPTLEHLILDVISLDYSETLNTGSGHQAEAARQKSMADHKGNYILVVDGSIPVKDGGIYCKIGGRTALDLLTEMASDSMAVISIGSCASWGGLPSVAPNPTGATPVHKILHDKGIAKPVVNIPGCPPNPYNFLSTVLHLLTFKKLPALDARMRPTFAYGRLIHENCERRPHFDSGRFAERFGDDGHRQGYCLYKLGCKGPETFNNCPSQLFGDVGSGSWPVGTGHPCFGCSEEGVGFATAIHSPARPLYAIPPTQFADAEPERGSGAKTLAAVVAGAAIGAGAVAAATCLRKKESSEDEKE